MYLGGLDTTFTAKIGLAIPLIQRTQKHTYVDKKNIHSHSSVYLSNHVIPRNTHYFGLNSVTFHLVCHVAQSPY